MRMPTTKKSKGPDEVVDTLRLSPAQVNALLQHLNDSAGGDTDPGRREHIRYIFENTGAILEVHHPGGTTIAYSLNPRNLSSGGLGFIHGSYLYEGSRCTVTFIKCDGNTLRVNGVICWARHITGRAHDIGLQFDNEIDTDLLICETPRIVGFRTQHPNDKPLAGRVLQIEKSPEDAKVLAVQLRDLGAKPETDPSAVNAVKRTKNSKYDMVIIGDSKENADPEQLATQLRAAGYKGSIIAFHAKDNPPHPTRPDDPTITASVERIYTQTQVLQRLGPYLKPGHKNSD